MKFSLKHLLLRAIPATTTSLLLLGCINSVATNPMPGAFEYREIYLPSTNPDDLKELGLNSVDDDWGIWGHNLSNVLPDKPSLSVYSRHDGSIDRHQFCFSSDRLYEYIVDYIDNNYRRTDSINFAILPNDNDIVCRCTECIRAGNTSRNASPAVLRLIEKLCKKFPNHTFFTSYYATTRSLPAFRLPANAGVLVSAIEYPLGASETPQEERFATLLKQWQKKSENVYVWDYVNNFDDYFTPFPILNVMQRRLKLYKDAGVDGVFLNGSGTDYSTFSHLHKVVLAKMMIDPEIDWKEELRKAALDYYPTAGADIADYIIAQEDFAATTGLPLPLYEGVQNSLKSHLQAAPTREFYSKIEKHIDTAGGVERERLYDLQSALSYTILELNRIEGKLEGSEFLLENLDKFPRRHIEYYNEAYWPIAKYIGDYEVLLSNFYESNDANLLKGTTLKALTPLDDDYNDISILTDGRLGIPSNYHNGLLISSADPALTIEIPRKPEMKTLKIWMAYNPAYRIGLPAELTLMVGGRELTAFPNKISRDTGHSVLEFRLPDVRGDVMRLRFLKDPEVRSFAIEEIQAF